MSTALVYIRQSRHKTYEATVSPEVQEEACRRLPAVAACDAVEVFADLDVSGGKRKGRVALERLLRRLEARDGEVRVVAAYDQSRAFRNTADALEFYALMEKLREVEVVFVHGTFDRSPAGEFTYTTLAAAHALERRMTAEKVRAAYRYKNARGLFTGMEPFGYRPGAGGRLEVDEEGAGVVRRVFELYASGTWSARAIAGRLNDEGVPRPRRRSRFGWLPDTVVDVLRNVAYIGKTYAESRARREGDLIAGDWPAIVDEPLFWRVQEMMGARRVRRSPRGREYAFGRLVACVRCGESMRATTNYGVAYYTCRRDVAPSARCPAPAARDDVLASWAAALFARLEGLEPAEYGEAVRAAGERRRPAASAEGVVKSLERLEKLFVWGHVTEDAYLAERARLEALRAELVAQAAGPARTIRVAGLGDAWSVATAGERRRLLGALFEKLYVDDGLVVRYVARREVREEVEELIAAAVGDELEYEAPRHGRGSNLRRGSAIGGEGGVSFRIRRRLEAAAG